MAFTYNDPVIFWEYAADIADACHERGIRTIAVTAGFMCPEPREEFYRHIDAANVDLKAFTQEFYHRVCAARLDDVLDTLRYLRHETPVWFEITTLLIPDHNDSDAEIDAETRWISKELGPDVPLHFTAFHPDYKMRDVPPTPPSTLRRARAIALGNGLRYVYTGNVHDRDGGTTSCPGCGEAVVVRDWYDVRRYRLDGQGRCRSCGAQLPGVYDGEVGAWGRRRLPVVVGARRMTRRPAAAGTFYPARAGDLAATVDSLLAAAGRVNGGWPPAAIVAPHAGYACSGPTAAAAYSRVEPETRIVAVLGPSHRGSLQGLAVPRETSWATPLGEVAIDDSVCRRLKRDGYAMRDDRPHRREHSIEVQLPLLQRVLRPGWTCVPVAVGTGDPERVADCMDALTADGDVLVVASTDLSHYHDEDTARRLDGRTCEAILDRAWTDIRSVDACGADALRGLLAWARRHLLVARLLDRSTSADTCGDASRVVGYAAFVLERRDQRMT